MAFCFQNPPSNPTQLPLGHSCGPSFFWPHYSMCARNHSLRSGPPDPRENCNVDSTIFAVFFSRFCLLFSEIRTHDQLSPHHAPLLLLTLCGTLTWGHLAGPLWAETELVEEPLMHRCCWEKGVTGLAEMGLGEPPSGGQERGWQGQARDWRWAEGGGC